MWHDEFVITVMRTPASTSTGDSWKKPLGIELAQHKQSVSVLRIDSGMIADWNKKHGPVEQLKVGQHIVAVNGWRGGGNMLESILGTDTLLEITVKLDLFICSLACSRALMRIDLLSLAFTCSRSRSLSVAFAWVLDRAQLA